MIVLGIESSCDETGVALYDSGAGLLGHLLHSQVELHGPYGGVVPELASRDHVRKALPLLRQVLDEAHCEPGDIDGVAYTAGPGMSIGHTHLKVSDLDRAISFYRDVIGLDVMQHYGDQAAFLSAGGYHHHIGLNTWESRGGTPPPKHHTGLYHTAQIPAGRLRFSSI